MFRIKPTPIASTIRTLPEKKLRFLGWLVLLLVSIEFILRLLGWTLPSSGSGVGMLVPDQLLGWRLRSGRSRLQTPAGIKLTTIDDLGHRATKKQSVIKSHENTESQKIIVVGDSFMFGFMLPDSTTFPWLIQSALPQSNVYNHAVPGYSTLQTLISLENWAQYRSLDNTIVLYGLAGFHGIRNVGHPWWQMFLAINGYGQATYPFCRSIENNHCIRSKDEPYYPELPWRSKLAVVFFIEELYVRVREFSRTADPRGTTEALLSELDRFVSSRGGKLIVFPMEKGAQDYTPYLLKNNIKVAKCYQEKYEQSEFRLYDGHPNAKQVADWLPCILDSVRS